MNKNNSKKLSSILNNKTSGSSELVQMLNNYFRSINESKTEILNDIQKSKAKLDHFEAVNKYLNKLKMSLRNKETLDNFLRQYSDHQKKKIEIIFNKIYPLLKNNNKIMTISRSGTVFEVLKLMHQKNRKLKVVVCESRPKLEGRLLARDLAKSGIKTELITDAMMSVFIPKVDTAVIGADVILKNKNVVNKVGSKSLALLCRDYNKPIFVVTTKSKVSRKNTYKQKKENPKEVLNKSINNLKVSNIYFEEIDRKYITRIITD
jgi:translation initiation factor 2B subunit (eIF-2B alpha/beta/delta family)